MSRARALPFVWVLAFGSGTWPVPVRAELPKRAERKAKMDYQGLERTIRGYADDADKVEGRPGFWQFTFRSVPIACIADQTHNRMRLVSPIIPEADLTEEHRVLMLRANFHTALDARYAVGNGMLFAAFVHPLDSLSERDLKSAIRQVASLAGTFGASYSSGELVFPGATGEEPKDDAKNGKADL